MGRAFWRVQAFWPQAKTLAQGKFTLSEHFKSPGSPQNWFCGADDKQLDDLSLAVTRREQDEPEA